MSPKDNLLLAALPPADYKRLHPRLELLSLPLGQILSSPADPQSVVYFPTTSMISMVGETSDGRSTELAVIGREGLIGLPLFMGGQSTNSKVTVESAGGAYQINADIVQEEFTHPGEFQRLVMRFIQALTIQMAQTAVCNRHHSIEQQLCRWFLMCMDRIKSHEMKMTQGLVSEMLGVRRESISEIAGRLQKDGLIKYYRGNVTILDRDKLEGHACECYLTVNQEYKRLLP